MIPAKILISYAKNRKKAYKAYGQLDHAKEKAVSEILRVCQYFLKTDRKGWTKQIRSEILELLPDEENDAHKWREKILTILI